MKAIDYLSGYWKFLRILIVIGMFILSDIAVTLIFAFGLFPEYAIEMVLTMAIYMVPALFVNTTYIWLCYVVKIDKSLFLNYKHALIEILAYILIFYLFLIFDGVTGRILGNYLEFLITNIESDIVISFLMTLFPFIIIMPACFVYYHIMRTHLRKHRRQRNADAK